MSLDTNDLVISLPVCPRCLWLRERVSSRPWSSSPGNWRCLGQRSKEHFAWTVRPTTQLPLPLAAKVSDMGLQDGWNLAWSYRHLCSLKSFCSFAKGGILEHVADVFLNLLILGLLSLRLGLCFDLFALCIFKAVFLRGLVTD